MRVVARRGREGFRRFTIMPFCSGLSILEKTVIPTRSFSKARHAPHISALGQLGAKENRPLSALISNLEGGLYTAREIVRESSKISRLFAIPPKPGPCPESPDSHGINTRQEIYSSNRGLEQ